MVMNKIYPSFLFDIGFSFFSDESIPKKYTQMSEECPLYFPFITPKLYLSVMDEITFVRQNLKKWPKIPTFFAFGKHDNVLNRVQTYSFIKDLPKNNNLKVKVYDSIHQITKCAARPEYLQDIFDFVQKHRR